MRLKMSNVVFLNLNVLFAGAILVWRTSAQCT